MSQKNRITALGVEVSNFHRLSVAEVKHVPGKGLVRVTGKNRAGKSTVLDAVQSTLAGAGAVRPMPVRVGTPEDQPSFTRLPLTNGFTLTRRYTEANPKGYLTVEGPDGGKHGQGKLDGWAGPLSFDPLAFFSLKPERQREIVLSLGSDPELPAKLKQLRAERGEKYAERTPWIAQKRKAAQAAKPAGERPAPVDVSAEMRRLGELQKAERERADMVRATERKREEVRREAMAAVGRSREAMRDATAEMDRTEAALSSCENEVSQLEERLEAAKVKRRHAQAARDQATEDAGQVAARLSTLPDPAAEAAAVPDPDLPPDPADEMEAVRARIEAADATNEAIEPWKAWDRARAEFEEADRAVDALTDVMGQLDVREQELVRSAGIPLPGVTFGDEGALLLNGLPLELASGAERIDLAVRVAIAVDPELGIVLVDEANDIDLDGLATLHELATEHGFQLWACRLGLEGEGEVVVEDGHARDRDRAESEAAAGASDSAAAAEAAARS